MRYDAWRCSRLLRIWPAGVLLVLSAADLQYSVAGHRNCPNGHANGVT